VCVCVIQLKKLTSLLLNIIVFNILTFSASTKRVEKSVSLVVNLKSEFKVFRVEKVTMVTRYNK